MIPLPARLFVGWLLLALLFVATGCQTETKKPLPPPPTGPITLPPRLPSRFAPGPLETVTTNVAQFTNAPPAVAAPVPVPAIPDKLFSFSAKDLDIKDALALFARNNDLNIVPDPDVTGTVTLDFRGLALDKAMEAILDSFGYYAEIDRGLIRVRSLITSTFVVDYLRLIRGGNASSSANIASGSGATGAGGSANAGKEVANITINQNDSIKFWDELDTQLKALISPAGSVGVNRTSGTIMVTDRKAIVDRIGRYLESVKKTLHRQVDLEARIYEIVLSDEFQLGIDWQNVTARIEDYYLSSGGIGGIPASGTIIRNPFGGVQPSTPSLSLVMTHKDAQVLLQALSEQGRIEVVSQPRIRTLNNQSALIKVGSDKPFFRTTVTQTPTSTQPVINTATEIQIITIGTVLSLTPQIAEDGWITLDISPIITRLIKTVEGPSGATAPEVDIKQSSSLVRLRDQQTVVLGGLIQDEIYKTTRKIPLLADIPILGKVFTGHFDSTRKSELVLFITPRLVD